MKLTAAREFSKDMEDSLFLMKKLNISSSEELFNIVEKYMHKNHQTPKSHYFIIEAFDKFSSSRIAGFKQNSLRGINDGRANPKPASTLKDVLSLGTSSNNVHKRSKSRNIER